MLSTINVYFDPMREADSRGGKTEGLVIKIGELRGSNMPFKPFENILVINLFSLTKNKRKKKTIVFPFILDKHSILFPLFVNWPMKVAIQNFKCSIFHVHLMM